MIGECSEPSDPAAVLLQKLVLSRRGGLCFRGQGNPGGTLPQGRPGPPQSLSGAETPKLSAVGEN